MRSKAVVFPHIRSVALQEIPVPDPGARDLVIGIEFSFLSNGTERWCLTGRLQVPGEQAFRFPHVPGYQAAGVVLGVGRDLQGYSPGDRVFSRNCRAPAGFEGSWWGGHVGTHVAGAGDVLKLPRSLSSLEGSALLIAQVGYNGAMKPHISPGDTAVVIGEGLVGQFAGQVLKSRGARVIMAGLMPERLEVAAGVSADEVFDNSRGGLLEFIRDRFPEGVPLVVETASSSETVRLAAELLGKNGQLVLNGFYPPGESSIDWHWLRRKEITLYCPDSRSRARLEATLGLMEEGRVRVKELVTHRVEADRVVEAYSLLLDPSAVFLGVVLDWGAR
jgi:3-hydroxyethyl bacteriochlorophyllide a dehydrogenase